MGVLHRGVLYTAARGLVLSPPPARVDEHLEHLEQVVDFLCVADLSLDAHLSI